ncbi:N-acetylmuramoyl-L-alanine amidase [Streptomyces venezuelae]|uniref:N-acetylmuramoyl-L-alanine amidase n=1 Tax=Streptomyces venezuelae TaxID=54571 RepID=UPI00278C734A|nr:N-acetylmuramoyl-L-alanine amidase [Streptomyces venezuelae]
MKYVRVPGRRLTAAAVTAALAATGGILAVRPATAAPAPVTAADAGAADQSTVVPFPLNAEVVSAGVTGFLSRTNVARGAEPEYRWTRYADGTSTVLQGWAVGGGSDLVVTGDGPEPEKSRVLTVHDMAAPSAAPVRVDLDELGENLTYGGVIGSTLIVSAMQDGVASQTRLVTVTDGRVTDREVTGLPTSDCWFAGAFAPGLAAFNCTTVLDDTRSTVLVDLAAGTAVEVRQDRRAWSAGAVSTTHVAWEELDDNGWGRIAVARRGSTDVRYVEGPGFHAWNIHLLGGWVLSGGLSSIDQRSPYPPGRPFLARLPETGETVEVLTHHSSAVTTPDGSLLVRGGTLDRDEGLYRVSLGENGRPVAELVASTGQSTAVKHLGTSVPDAITFDRAGQVADLGWEFSRVDTDVWLTLVHERTGERSRRKIWSTDPAAPGEGYRDGQRIGWRWDGSHPLNPLQAAYNGAYTWEITATPDDSIGPEAKVSGRFTVNRAPAPHDYNDNGTPDLLLFDDRGALLRSDTNRTPSGDGIRRVYDPTKDGVPQVGHGWNIYDRAESVGDVAGTRAGDVVGRDKSGVLWLYQGTGNGGTPFLGRVKVGGGWQTYEHLAGGSDLTGDGRPDLLATDKAGGLWLYRATGNVNAPFSPRKQIGNGWGIYNQLTATGDIAGGVAGDLLARDKEGVLWLYPGKGDGTLAPRVRVGGGWNAYPHLVGIGDGNGDGRADLLAMDGGGNTYSYAGTGDYLKPFKPRVASDLTSSHTWFRPVNVF